MVRNGYYVITEETPYFSEWVFVKETDCRDDTDAFNVQAMWKQRSISSKSLLQTVFLLPPTSQIHSYIPQFSGRV